MIIKHKNDVFEDGKRLFCLPFKTMKTSYLAEVYAYALVTFGRNHPKTNLILDELNNRDYYLLEEGY